MLILLHQEYYLLDVQVSHMTSQTTQEHSWVYQQAELLLLLGLCILLALRMMNVPLQSEIGLRDEL